MSSGRAAETEAAAFFAWLSERRILPQYIVYSDDDLRRYHELREASYPAPRAGCCWCWGYSGGESTPWNLLPFLRLEPDGPWAVCAFGAAELDCAACAAVPGGHARVGFENNLQLRDGRRAPDNAALIARAAQAAASGRPLATAAQLRALFEGWG